jgi:hypothetical protein
VGKGGGMLRVRIDGQPPCRRQGEPRGRRSFDGLLPLAGPRRALQAGAAATAQQAALLLQPACRERLPRTCSVDGLTA